MSPAFRRCRALPAAALLVLLTACSGAPDTLYPLEPGRWWYYRITQVVLDEPRHVRYLLRNLGRTTLDGETVHVQAAQSTSRDLLRRAGDALERVARMRPGTRGLERDVPPHTVLPAAREPGTRWTVTSTLGLVESRTFARADRVVVRRYPVTIEKTIVATGATVVVPAGRFEGCLEIAGRGRAFVRTDRGNSEAEVNVETREWFAPGTGLVRLERIESSTSPFLKAGRQTWELADYGG